MLNTTNIDHPTNILAVTAQLRHRLLLGVIFKTDKMVDIFESAKTTMSTVGNLAIACSLAELASLYVSANDCDVPVLTLRLTDTLLSITGAIS